MSDELRWAIGIAVSVVLTIGGMLIAQFRSLSNKMERRDEIMRTAVKDGDDALHERINRVRDEYVRRVDLDQQLKHFEAMQAEIMTDIKAILSHTPRR